MSGLASLTAQYTDSEGEDDRSQEEEMDDNDEDLNRRQERPNPPDSGPRPATDSLNRDMQRVLGAPPVAQLHVSGLHRRVEITPNGSTGPLVSYERGEDEGSDSDDDDEQISEVLQSAENSQHSNEESIRESTKPMDMDIDSQSSSQVSSTSAADVVRPASPLTYHRELLKEGPQNVQLPPEPPGKCSADLQARIADYYEKTKRGANMVNSIQRKKAFRNPSIYEKLLVHCDIDELGTNFPPEIFSSHAFKRESYYDEISKRQTEEMHRREKERKTKVDFIVGTAKKTATEAPPAVGVVKKSKWDQGAAAPHIVARGVAAPGVVSMPTGTKQVIINAIGNLPKPKNVVTHVQAPRR